ncbi:Lysosomal alpha-mannosidase [Pseudolycoriella hygida]|uniref:Alpha-mannosidase n=1 Tax=Pseudolycoriella hygida TaxID=35572 RepID=A0A9Q0S608_9DIPT|nr:Lysosomal alpha-mannosidase [Pseudolycoriella hygida]
MAVIDNNFYFVMNVKWFKWFSCAKSFERKTVLRKMYSTASLFAILIFSQFFNAFSLNVGSRASIDETCGYQACHATRSDILNVHLIAHTHDDVGWLKTADQYYYGGENRIQKAAVDVIIDSAVDALLQDPSRRFIYVETAFFSKWWNDQDEAMQEQVKMLVNEGRLEFIGGAWSMNDEAGTHYQSIIDHFSWGLRFLNDTFGECGRPKVGWQIDPFGHSREQASLFAQMGYDGFFVTRLDYQDKQNRMNTKTMEVVWKSSENLGKLICIWITVADVMDNSFSDSDIFTGALFNEYANPPGFCFDILCEDEPMIDDLNSTDYNMDKKATEFANYAKNQASYYRTNNILITMGEDFYYMSAQMWFKNMDKLIKYTNEHQDTLKVNLIYSTPSCYLKALYDSNIEWPTKSDDYFPYASDPNCYWTGYFTSRPNSKRFERLANQFLQVCKKLSATAPTSEETFDENLERLRSQMGVMQHHDAITGTEKQNVTNDYHRELTASIQACETNTRSALNQFVTGTPPSQSGDWELQFHSCLNLNISVCEWSENAEVLMVTVYNPLSYVTSQYARFPVAGSNYQVRDADSYIVLSQLVPIASPVKNLHYRVSSANWDLVFRADSVPALGYKTFYVDRIVSPLVSVASVEPKLLDDIVTIGTDELNVTFDVNGLLSEISVDGVSSKLSQNFLFYKGFAGNNREYKNRSSGAYIFRPKPDETVEIVGTDVSLEVVRGVLVDEVHQIFNEWISQVVRIYKTEKYVEFEWMVGPIPIDDDVGKEIVTRFTTDINNNGVFYTDSNGREMIRREINKRGTWNLQVNEPISGNYYPINAKVILEEGFKRLAILTDRSQGGSSLIDGTVEIMVHRRLLSDDAKGVGEALNETAYGEGIIARGKHYLIYSRKTNQIGQERLLQNEILMSNWLFFDDISGMSYDNWLQRYTHSNSSLKQSLPQNVYLMTLEPWKDGGQLIRFEHILDKYDDAELSKPVSFDLKDVFPGDFDFAEVSLAANQWIESSKRLRFKQIGYPGTEGEVNFPKLESTSITFEPMQIRSFVMTSSTVGSSGIQHLVFKTLFVLVAVMILSNFR